MKKRKNTDRVIFHHSLSAYGDVPTFRGWHLAKGFHDIGYHYVILPTGECQSGRDLRLVGAHAYGRNGRSVGVCLVGDFRHTEPTYEQIEASQRLYHQLCRAFSKSLKIAFHRYSWVFNSCPGKKMDRADFKEILARADPYINKK